MTEARDFSSLFLLLLLIFLLSSSPPAAPLPHPVMNFVHYYAAFLGGRVSGPRLRYLDSGPGGRPRSVFRAHPSFLTARTRESGWRRRRKVCVMDSSRDSLHLRKGKEMRLTSSAKDPHVHSTFSVLPHVSPLPPSSSLQRVSHPPQSHSSSSSCQNDLSPPPFWTSFEH